MPSDYIIEYDSPDMWSEEEFIDPPASGYLSDDPTLCMARVMPFERHVLHILKQPTPYYKNSYKANLEFALCPWLCEARVNSKEAFEMLKIRLSDVNFHIVNLRHETSSTDLGVVHDSFTFVLTLIERNPPRELPFDHHPMELLASYGAVWAHFELLVRCAFSLLFDESLKRPLEQVSPFF